MCEAATPSAIAASAVLASGKASAAAKAKPTTSFRSMVHFPCFGDAQRVSMNRGAMLPECRKSDDCDPPMPYRESGYAGEATQLAHRPPGADVPMGGSNRFYL